MLDGLPWAALGAAIALALGVLWARTATRRSAEGTEHPVPSAGTQQTGLHQEAQRAALTGIASAFEALSRGVLLVDADRRVHSANHAFRALFALTGAVEGRLPLELVRAAGLARVLDGLSSGAPFFECDDTPGGEPGRVLHWRGTRLRDVELTLVEVEDISERTRLESMRTDFVANVSHELRTPLAAIRGFAETLKAGALKQPDVAEGMVDIIHRQAQRLSRLVEDLLALSHVESGARVFRIGREALAPVIERVVLLYSQRIAALRMEVAVEVDGAAVARVDVEALEQVVSNLLDNALKYTPSGGRIRLCAQRKERWCCLEVQDNGPGIPPEHLGRLFERFYRVEPSRSRELGGTGLGLALVKHLVVALGGEVEVESRVGEGSTFRVRLPAA